MKLEEEVRAIGKASRMSSIAMNAAAAGMSVLLYAGVVFYDRASKSDEVRKADPNKAMELCKQPRYVSLDACSPYSGKR
jgi:hypothetical protein